MSERVYAQVRPRQKASVGSSSRGVFERASRFEYAASQIPLYSSRPLVLQTKLTVNQPGDVYEQEADHVAAQVMRMPEPQLQRACSGCQAHQEEDEHKQLQMKSVGAGSPGQTVAPPIVHEVLRSQGQPLDAATRTFMEPRFGHDFSQVRIHSDMAAERSTRDVHALAYTVGHDIVFGAGQFAPRTHEGQRLLAHELTHVVQQSGADGFYTGQDDEKRDTPSDRLIRRPLTYEATHVVQRQVLVQEEPIPQELRSSANVRQMKPDELQARYDLIVQVMKRFTASTPDYMMLDVEMQAAANELARRQALKAGRTFGDAEVAKMKEYFIKNATSAQPKSCIVCMNDAMRLLLGSPQQKVGSEVEKTMGKLQQSGHAGNARVIEFEDTKGRITRGTLFPDKLHESVWGAVIRMGGGDVGWSIFGMSLMDGYHSVTLTLDNNDPLMPHIYWSDQWSTKGGWKEYTQTTLDAEITHLTQAWWQPYDEKHKPNTRTTLWHLNP